MNTKTFNQAIIDIIISKVCNAVPNARAVFTAYDITTALRRELDSKSYDLSDRTKLINSEYPYEVYHSEVKEFVEELFSRRLLVRNHTGQFYLYGVVDVSYLLTLQNPVYVKLCELIEDTLDCGKGTVFASPTFCLDDLLMDEEDISFLESLIETEYDTSINLNGQSTLNDITVQVSNSVAVKPATGIKPPQAYNNVLKNYIDNRINEGVNPVLKNAQKSLAGKNIKFSVSEIAKLARGMGYKISGPKDVAFSEWTISK